MTHILPIIQSMAATSSRKEKQAILEANSKNMLLARYLQVTYNPKYNFYLQAIQGTKAPQDVPTLNFDGTFIEYFLQEIAGRRRTGGEAREFVESQYAFMSPDDRQLFAWMLNRDIKAGCSVSTFNKVWPGLIETIPYMRCSLPKHNNPKDWFEQEPGLLVFSQEKMDAMFASLSTFDEEDEHKVSIASRTGSPFPLDAFEDIVTHTKACFRNVQLHGELMVFDEDAQEYLAREKSNGYMNSMLQGGDINPKYKPRFVAWDIIPLFEAKAKGKYNMPYSGRFDALSVALSSVDMGASAGILLVDNKMLGSYEELEAHYAEIVALGREGTVVKHPKTIWEDGTSLTQIKMKQEIDVELKIVGFNEGSGRLETTFGSLICESADGDLQVGVSGLSDKLRQEIWAKKDDMIGKIVTIKGNKVMSPLDQDAKHSIFLPRFVEIRNDKTEANTLAEIKDAFTKA